jgi:hypothetical protein
VGVQHRTLSNCGTAADGSVPEIPNYVTVQNAQQFLKAAAEMINFIWFISGRGERNSYRKIQQDATVYQNLLFHIYMNLNMFRATHRPSSGA